MTSAKPFTFINEFTADGEILSGAKPTYVPVSDVEAKMQKARAEADAMARQGEEARIASALEAIANQLKPVLEIVSHTTQQLRAEAIELGLAAAKTIADRALDENGHQAAADAIAKTTQTLKDNPVLIISAAPEVEKEVSARLQNIPGFDARIQFEADPNAKPGDWRVEFSNGVKEFSRESVEQAIEALLDQHKSDPGEVQMDLFGAA